MDTKTCSKCGVEYPATTEYFYFHKRSKGGLRRECVSCCNRSSAQYAARNANRIAEYKLRYRTENADRIRNYRTQYNAAHRVEIRHYGQQRYSVLREQILDANAQYRATHPEVFRIACQRRRARQRGLPNIFTTHDYRRMMEYWHNSCAFCRAQQDFRHTIEQEHWIAVTDSSSSNPGTVPTNIIPACRSCNASKSNRNAYEWLLDTFGKRKATQISKRIHDYFEWVRQQEQEAA